MFDASHHMTDLGAVLDGIRAALRSDGLLLLADRSASGEAAADAADPTAIILYGSETLRWH
jgi:hypothetical protein